MTSLLACAVVFVVLADDARERLASASSTDSPVPVDPARGPEFSTAVIDARAAVAENWRTRERARSAGNISELRRVSVPPVLAADVAHASRARGKRPRVRVDSHVLLPTADSLQMLAWLKTATGATFLLAYVRESVADPWRIAVEVPFDHWPWHGVDGHPEARRVPFSPATALRPVSGGRRIVRAVAVPIDHGKTLVCGGFRAPARSGVPLEQICVGVGDARPGVPLQLGARLGGPQ